MAGTDDKQQAHQLLDQLEGRQLAAVVRLLRMMADPVARAIANAPVEEEPLAPGAIRALDEARQWTETHAGIPHEQVLAELGFTQEEIAGFNKAR